MADSPENTVMPHEIAKAVIAVMGKIEVLAKDNKNKFDHYKYASIDDFIMHVREHCTTAGLFIVPSEDGAAELVQTTKKDGSPLMMWRARHAFTLCHSSGEAYGPIYKTVMVQANGAQASGSAQSYALKQLMRGLFLIPTGDKDDPDKQSAEISASGNVESAERKVAQTLYTRLQKAADLDILNLLWTDSSIPRDGYTKEIQDHLLRAYEARRAELDKE